jgi:hypothetical protein
MFALAIYFIQYSNMGYNFSIYDQLPYESLVLIILSNICGFFITLSFYRNGNDFWKLGFVLIILSNIIIILLPFVLGYSYSSNSDHLTHMGFIKDILQTGTIKSGLNRNIYPITPILSTEISLFTGIQMNTVAFFIGLIFYLAFILYTYIFSKSITTNSKFFSLMASTILIGYYFKEIFPMGFAFLTYPLIFYVFFKYREEKNINFAILVVFLVSFMAFFHIISSLILTILLFCYEIFNFSYGYIYHKKKNYEISVTLTILSLIILILWMWQISWVWDESINNILRLANLDLLSKPMVQTAGESFNKLGLNGFQIIELFIKTYLPIFIFAILSAIAGLKIIFNKKSAMQNRLTFILSLMSVICIFLWLIDYVFPLSSLTSGRLLWLVVPIFPIFVGISLYSITKSKKVKNEKLNYTIIFIILITCSLITLFALYPSPPIYKYNTAVSNSEIMGFEWIINESNHDIQTIGAGFEPTYRYENALKGTLNTKRERTDWKGVSDHFNYTEFNQIGEEYNKDKYMILRTNFLKSLYGGIYKNLNRFNDEDFNKLSIDQTTFKIYQNGETDIWYIKSINS